MITKIKSKHLNQVINLHKRIFSGDFITSLKDKFLYVMYEKIIDDENSDGFVDIVEAKEDTLEQVRGFIIGTFVGNNFYSETIKRNWFLIIRVLMWNVLRNPFYLRTIISVSKALCVEFNKDTPQLLYIGIDEKYKGEGMGSRLVDAWLGRIKQKGYDSCSARTRRDNKIACKFYEKKGFKKLENLKDKNFIFYFYRIR